jgi:hypothetical protein
MNPLSSGLLFWNLIFSGGFMSERFQPSSPRPVLPSFFSKPKLSLKFILAIVFILLFYVAGGSYIAYLFHKNQVRQETANRKVMEREQAQLQLQKALVQKVEDIRTNGTSLPPCPVIYPLLDEKGKMTDLGSYLSCFAMEKATYLPQSVYQLPTVFNLYFQEYHFFPPQATADLYYKPQLSYEFNSGDFGDGTLKKNRKGFKINLHFWGTHPEKKYQKTFTRKNLNLAINWMAACVHDFTGFKPTPEQAAYRDQPVFDNGDTLVQASGWEKFFQDGGSNLVLHWDKIMVGNPEEPFLIGHKLVLLYANDYGNYLGWLEPLALKHPDSTIYRYLLQSEYCSAKKYDQALDIDFAELKRDDNNSLWYNETVSDLEWKGDWINAYRLLKNWTEKYPDNPRALVTLGTFMENWAWEARGNDVAGKVAPKAWPLFTKRIAEGYVYIQKAMANFPDYWLSWDNGLFYGNGADLDRDTMERYFQKAVKLNPSNKDPYSQYLNYLQPKWNGSEKDFMDLAVKSSEKYPYILVHVLEEKLREDDNLRKKKFLTPESQSAYLHSYEWALMEKNIRLYLLQWPYDTGTWEDYFMWAEAAGQLEEACQWVSQLGGKDPYMAALPAALMKAREDAHYWNLETGQEKSVYWTGTEGLKRKALFDLEMAKLEPENWFWLNKAICFQVHSGQVDAALETFKRIGEAHWDPTTCEKSDWEMVKSWAIATPTAVPGPSLLHPR